MSDAEALEWLDRLLEAGETERQASLAAIAASHPELHARLRRLLASALAPDNSRVLASPVLDGVARLALDATRGLQPGDVLAGYRLIREIGRGGMAVVWLAERADGVVKRNVALKMPMFMLQGAGDAERFARERDALAALSHPNVARLYDAGVLPSGQPFIVLEHIEGVPFTVHCDAQRLGLRARLRLFLQVLAAVEHAHKHLVVHRDLKPSNILVDGDGQVKLLDFGIAKLLGEQESLASPTMLEGAAMTPLYAAPEQLHGAPISTLTDVFALGLVLHETLTGALPYRSAGARATPVEVLDALRRGALPRASQAHLEEAAALGRGLASAGKLRRELAGDLDTVVSKALRIAPEERYGSAAHLAEDIKRYLDSKPIAARPPSLRYRARLALSRHRLAASVAAVGIALVAGASVVALLQYRESRAHAERTAAVRDFMFELVDDAEADEHQEGDVTGRQMVDGAVLRARRDFVDEPQLQGELLGELGRMYVRLRVSEIAVPVLEESIRLLERNAPPDDPALNKSRVNLAAAVMQSSEDLPRVQTLAAQARDACRGADVECAKARAYAENILSQLASYRGDTEGSLAAMRRSVADTEIGFGPSHEETAIALLSLAIIARNSGRLIEAGQAMERAVKISADLHMRAADRTSIERTMAVLDHDLGRFDAARARLEKLVVGTKEPVERALQWRLLANTYAELGEKDRALAASDSALALSRDKAAARELPFALQARARALGLAGRYAEALAEIDAANTALLASGRAAESPEAQRIERLRCELLFRSGQLDTALSGLMALRDVQQRTGASPVDFGRTLDLLGSVRAARGDWRGAAESHDAAGRELAKGLPPGHPDLIRNAALREAAARFAQNTN